MRSLRDATDDVYVILRVFGLGSEHISARAFVNPAKLEDTGVLEFTADKWTVVGP